MKCQSCNAVRYIFKKQIRFLINKLTGTLSTYCETYLLKLIFKRLGIEFQLKSIKKTENLEMFILSYSNKPEKNVLRINMTPQLIPLSTLE
jgi:hypothetical protein